MKTYYYKNFTIYLVVSPQNDKYYNIRKDYIDGNSLVQGVKLNENRDIRTLKQAKEFINNLA